MILVPEPPSLAVLLATLAVACLLALAYLRAVSTIARWMTLGPGRPQTRAIVGTFLLSLLYAGTIAVRRPQSWVQPTIEDFAWLAFPLAFVFAGWSAAAALGERDVIRERPVARTSFGLRDALLALALFGVTAAAFRFAIGPGIRWTIETDLSDALYWIAFFSLILLVVVWIDVAVRISFAGESRSVRPAREALKGLSAAGILAAMICLVPPPAGVVVIPILGTLAVCYAGLAMGQEALIRRFGIRPTSVRRPVVEARQQALT